MTGDIYTYIWIREDAHYCPYSGLSPVLHQATTCANANLYRHWNPNSARPSTVIVLIDRTLQWCHNGHNVTGLCEGNSQVTGEFPAQSASNAENVSIWWRHHEIEMIFSKFLWLSKTLSVFFFFFFFIRKYHSRWPTRSQKMSQRIMW